MSHGVMAEEMC